MLTKVLFHLIDERYDKIIEFSGKASGGRGAPARRLPDLGPGGDVRVLLEAGGVLPEDDGTHCFK